MFSFDWEVLLSNNRAESVMILIGLVVALFGWHLIHKLLTKGAAKTVTILDDLTIQALRWPVYAVLILSAFFLFLSGPMSALIPVLGRSEKFLPYVFLGGVLWFCLGFANRLETFLTKVRQTPEHLRKSGVPALPGFFDLPALLFMSKFLRASIIAVFALTLMSMLGVSISALLAFGGISGIIVGLAVRETVANFLSGLFIFWDRPFVVGDWIRCPSLELEGVVEEINWRVTKIRNFERRPVYVPNALFMNHYLENPQRMTHRRFNERFGVRYEDLDKLPGILEDIRAMIDEHQRTDTKENWVVRFDEYGESALIFFVAVVTPATDWTEFHRIKEEILFKVAHIVRKHGAEFAYPTRRIVADSSPGQSESLTQKINK